MLLLAWVGSADAQAPGISPSMRGPTALVQVQIVSGRLSLTPRQGIRTRSSASNSGNDRRERMMVDLMGTHPIVDYELVTSQWQLVVQARNQTNFRIAQRAAGRQRRDPVRVPSGRERRHLVHVGAGEQRKRRFSTIWHLLLVEPEAAKTHLVPMLEFFRPNWNLAATMESITEALFTNADDRRAAPRRRWALLVAQLSDTRYSRRESADRELRAEGKAVLSFLDALDSDTLDFEQRHRIQRIRRSLTRGDNTDAAESIAAWLGSDPRVWFALLNHAELQRRRVAAAQLSRLLGEEFAFDAAADTAVRNEQIEALRRKVETPPAVPPVQARLPAGTD